MSRLLPLLLALVLAGCASTPASPTVPDVAIYLPRQPLSGGQIMAADLGTLPLQPEPIVANDEILSYSASTHDLTLAPAAVKRISELEVPVQGLGFVICVDKQPVFGGAFWVLWSSLSFDGPTINLPLDPTQTSLHIYSGYPDLDGVLPNDPRTDPRLLDAFRQSSRLR